MTWRFAIYVLLGLVGARVSSAAADERFHTSPECWQEARIFHPGPPPADIANRIHLIGTPATVTPPGDPTISPNGGYRFWVRNPDTTRDGPWGAALIVDVERQNRPTLLFENVAQPIQPRWLNEKLIFLRVAWGRIVFSDLILDVEAKKLVYNEIAEYGQLAFEQYKQACGGRCPCEPASEVRPLPDSRPAAEVLIGLLEMPTIFGPGEIGGVTQATDPKAVPIYAQPFADAEIIARPVKPEDLAYREIGYEAGAAVVLARQPGWYRIRIDAKTGGWVKVGDVGRYTPLADLLPARLAYLNEHWDGEVWSSPEPGASVTRSALKKDGERQEYSVEIREARNTDRGLWLHVALLEHDPCAGGEPGVADEGWIPAYSKSGQLTAWFHSRGC